jgi:RNA polymerase sigma factor (sigma-70 family)
MEGKSLFKIKYKPYQVYEERKPILIRGEVRHMTFDDLLAIYKGIIISRVKSWTKYYDYDDLYQICLIELYKLYKKHDHTLGYNFGTVNGQKFTWALLEEHEKNQRKYAKYITVSIDAELYDKEGNGSKLQDILGADDEDIKNYDLRLLFEKMLSNLSEDDKRQIVDIFVEDKTEAKIAKERNLSGARIHHKKDAVLNKLRKMYQKEVQYA